MSTDLSLAPAPSAVLAEEAGVGPVEVGDATGAAGAVGGVAAGGIRWPGATYSAFQAVVDAIRDPNLRTTADVDEAALARTLAPLITAQVAALTDEDVARIATAASDEHARRLALRG